MVLRCTEAEESGRRHDQSHYDQHKTSYQSKYGVDDHIVCGLFCGRRTVSRTSPAVHVVCFAYRCEHWTECHDLYDIRSWSHCVEHYRGLGCWTFFSFVQ